MNALRRLRPVTGCGNNMPSSQPRPEEIRAARLEVQWVNHLLDDAPHDPELWFRKAVRFETAMHGTIPETALLERVLLWYRHCLVDWDGLWMVYHNSAATFRRLNRHAEAIESARSAVDLRPDRDPSARGRDVTVFDAVHLFVLQRLHETLGLGVIVGVAFAAHADLDLVFTE